MLTPNINIMLPVNVKIYLADFIFRDCILYLCLPFVYIDKFIVAFVCLHIELRVWVLYARFISMLSFKDLCLGFGLCLRFSYASSLYVWI